MELLWTELEDLIRTSMHSKERNSNDSKKCLTHESLETTGKNFFTGPSWQGLGAIACLKQREKQAEMGRRGWIASTR